MYTEETLVTLTMSSIQVESGIQFLARIKNSKLSLRNIETLLFPEGLKEQDVVELTADSIYGKNALLMHLLRNAALVGTHDGRSVGGLDTSVLVIDTAFQFQVTQLASYLRSHVDTLDISSFCRADREEVVKKSLKNVMYISCYDSQQLLATFHYLRTTISLNPKIKLLVLDNVGANYWQDFMNGGLKRMDLYEKKMLSMLQKVTKDFKLSILFIRPKFFVLKNPSGCNVASYRVHIKQKNDIFEAIVSTKSSNVSKSFSVASDGIKWL